MFYVYMLRSEKEPAKTYVGFTANLKARLAYHNGEGSPEHTARHRPWRLVTYIVFDCKVRALAFEKYLKSHAGKAFGSKRLW